MLRNTSIVRPVITEKSMREVSLGRYTFEVSKDATKQSIRAAMKELYQVDPMSVQTIHVPGKRRRAGRRRQEVVLASWKKAVIRIKPDQKLDLFEVAVPEKSEAKEKK